MIGGTTATAIRRLVPAAIAVVVLGAPGLRGDGAGSAAANHLSEPEICLAQDEPADRVDTLGQGGATQAAQPSDSHCLDEPVGCPAGVDSGSSDSVCDREPVFIPVDRIDPHDGR